MVLLGLVLVLLVVFDDIWLLLVMMLFVFIGEVLLGRSNDSIDELFNNDDN